MENEMPLLENVLEQVKREAIRLSGLRTSPLSNDLHAKGFQHGNRTMFVYHLQMQLLLLTQTRFKSSDAPKMILATLSVLEEKLASIPEVTDSVAQLIKKLTQE